MQSIGSQALKNIQDQQNAYTPPSEKRSIANGHYTGSLSYEAKKLEFFSKSFSFFTQSPNARVFTLSVPLSVLLNTEAMKIWSRFEISIVFSRKFFQNVTNIAFSQGALCEYQKFLLICSKNGENKLFF